MNKFTIFFVFLLCLGTLNFISAQENIQAMTGQASVTAASTSNANPQIVSEKKECQEEVNAIGRRIVEIRKAYLDELLGMYPTYSLVAREYFTALKSYKECLSQRTAQKITSSGITANIVVADVAMTNSWASNNLPVTENAGNGIVPTIDTPAEYIAAEKMANNMEREIEEVPETNLEMCKEQRILVKTKVAIVRQEISKIKALKEKYKVDFEKVEKLRAQRQEIIKRCYPQLSVVIKPECAVSEEMLAKQKELQKKIVALQSEFITPQATSKKEFMAEYKKVKEEHRLVTEKINTIKNECQQRSQIISNIDYCSENAEQLKIMEQLKQKLVNAIDETEIYELKTKMAYYQQKINNTKCISRPTTEKPLTEIEMYKKQIQELKAQIHKKDLEIRKLKESIEAIRLELKNAGQERKAEVLAQNADKILEHTREILEKRIAELKEKISSIEASTEITTEEKTKIIDKINQRIAELEMIKSKLTEASTPQELRQIINAARKSEEKAIIENKIATLKKSISKLANIIETHFVNSENYERYKIEIDNISTKTSELTSQSSKKKIDTIVYEYKELKQKIVSEAESNE